MNWRSITLLLISINFVYWAWNTWIVLPSSNPPNHPLSQETPRLKLADETQLNTEALQSSTSLVSQIDQTIQATDQTDETNTQELTAEIAGNNDIEQFEYQDNAPSSSTQTLETQAVQEVCHRIGYFSNDAELQTVTGWFREEGISVSQVQTIENVFIGYWVHLPAYPNQAAAQQVVSALREKGIQDLFVELRAPHTNAISLGLFKQKSGADRRLKQLQTLGFPAKIANREPEQTVNWLEFDLDINQEVPLARIPVSQGQVRRLERRACEDVNS